MLVLSEAKGQAWAIRWQLWLTVPVTDSYTFAVYADDGFVFNGTGLSVSNGTTRAPTTTETASGVVLTPGLIYNFAFAYMNYTTATTSTIQLLWRRAGGQLELVPREAIHARGRRDYYSFGGAVVAMKDGVMQSVTRTLSYLHGDHLGSASLTTDISGTVVSQQRYKPYGEVRWTSGAGMPTDKQFTGQTRLAEGYVGTLYDYVARAYDPVLGRFISADTIVPGASNPASLNRYTYVRGNPLRYVDPSGHMEASPDDNGCGSCWIFATSDAGKSWLVNTIEAKWQSGYASAGANAGPNDEILGIHQWQSSLEKWSSANSRKAGGEGSSQEPGITDILRGERGNLPGGTLKPKVGSTAPPRSLLTPYSESGCTFQNLHPRCDYWVVSSGVSWLDFTVTSDRQGNKYLNFGLGPSAVPISIAYGEGWIKDGGYAEQFLDGYATSFQVGFGMGAGFTVSGPSVGDEVYIMTPNAGWTILSKTVLVVNADGTLR